MLLDVLIPDPKPEIKGGVRIGQALAWPGPITSPHGTGLDIGPFSLEPKLDNWRQAHPVQAHPIDMPTDLATSLLERKISKQFLDFNAISKKERKINNVKSVSMFFKHILISPFNEEHIISARFLTVFFKITKIFSLKKNDRGF